MRFRKVQRKKNLRNTKEQQKNKRNLIYLIFKKYLTIVSHSIQRGNRMSNTNQKKKKKPNTKNYGTFWGKQSCYICKCKYNSY